MKTHLVNLTDEERETLRQYTRTGYHSAQSIIRAHILLLADEQGAARNDAAIAQQLKINIHTVENNRRRYVQHGLQAVLQRAPRKDKGQPVKVDGRVEAHLITLACSATPNGEPSWTLSMLSDALVKLEIIESISRETVRKTLKKMHSNRI